MAVASSESPAPNNPEDSEGHKEASGKKKKNRCMSCKKKVGLTGNLTFSFSNFTNFTSDLFLPRFNVICITNILFLFQDSHADAEGCSAQYIVTVISTNARSTIKSLVLKKSGNPIPSWWPAKCRKSRKFVASCLGSSNSSPMSKSRSSSSRSNAKVVVV